MVASSAQRGRASSGRKFRRANSWRPGMDCQARLLCAPASCFVASLAESHDEAAVDEVWTFGKTLLLVVGMRRADLQRRVSEAAPGAPGRLVFTDPRTQLRPCHPLSVLVCQRRVRVPPLSAGHLGNLVPGAYSTQYSSWS